MSTTLDPLARGATLREMAAEAAAAVGARGPTARSAEQEPASSKQGSSSERCPRNTAILLSLIFAREKENPRKKWHSEFSRSCKEARID